MASDFVLVINGLKGETQRNKLKDKGGIDVTSFSWGVNNSGSSHTQGGGGTGKASFQDLHFTKPVDKASPDLMHGCATGKVYDDATLYVHKAGGSQEVYYSVKLDKVLISSFVSSASGQDVHEQFSLNFAKFEFAYSPQKDDGSLDAEVKKKFDLKAGT